jgi:hypothetical protein
MRASCASMFRSTSAYTNSNQSSILPNCSRMNPMITASAFDLLTVDFDLQPPLQAWFGQR